MQKLNFLTKLKQIFINKDKSLILLIIGIFVIVLMCVCLLSEINQYKRNCEELSAQYDKRLDRCEELLLQIETRYTEEK